MRESPYEPPSLTTAQPSVLSHRGAGQRPIGVTILAVLLFSGGVVLLGAQLLFLANLSAVEGSMLAAGIHPVLFSLGLLLLTTVSIVAGIGMWRGRNWGWKCGAFYWVYGIFRNAWALILVLALGEQVEDARHGQHFYIAKFAARAIVDVLLSLYFFKGNVLAYFGLEDLHKARAIGFLVGLSAAITVGAVILDWVLS